MENNEVKDSEILFLYEGKLTNPNGDIDDENRPRMDYDTFTNLVSDVRLKRYVRDYMSDKGENIFINHGDVKTAGDRLEEVLPVDYKNNKYEFLTNKFIDVRLFGAMIPVQDKKGQKRKGDSIKIVGPVQFSWGYSLNKVELVNSYSITGGFSGSEENKMNSIGKDYRLYYSLIAFYGVISSKRAAKANLNKSDIENLDDALLKSIPSQATRSKINQMPLLYIRTESNGNYLGDLRDYIKLNIKNEPIRSVNDYSINIDPLLNALDNRKDISISKIWAHSNLEVSNIEKLKSLKNRLI